MSHDWEQEIDDAFYGDDFIASWEERADWALGNAGSVLEYVSEKFLAGEDVDAITAATLAEAWRELANTYIDRIRQTLDLLEEGVDESEEEPSQVTA